MEKHEWSSDELRHKAEAYCAGTEHCCSEIKTKLLQWGADETTINFILAHLQQHKYIDEERKLCPKCMDKAKLIKRLMGFFVKYKGYMLLIMLTFLLSGGLTVLSPYVSNKVFYDDVLTEGGVRAIWNFAPVHLTVPEGVLVQHENLASSLALLSHHLMRDEKERGEALLINK